MSSASGPASGSSLPFSSPSDTRMPDLVRDTRLETSFNGDDTVHLYDYSSDDDASSSRPTRRAEHWRWEQQLARGGSGEVWLQRCTQGKRTHGMRAVKMLVLDDGGARGKPKGVRIDYMQELEAIAKFSQKRYAKWFTRLLGWYTDAANLFIAMEYFPLGDLQMHISKHAPMDEADVREITHQVLEGLHCMHREDFAHRDVKPGNVLIKTCPPGPWWVKVSDFGISKRVEESVADSTFKGTRAYMAPELLRYEPGRPYRVDNQAADMWSLGEMVFLMLTKSAAFPSYLDLAQYLARPDLFPSSVLEKHNASGLVAGFVQSLMKPAPQDRLASDKALDHEWFLPCKASAPALASFQMPIRPSPTANHQLNATIATDPWATRTSTSSGAAWNTTPLAQGAPDVRRDLQAAVEVAEDTARQGRLPFAEHTARQLFSPGPSIPPAPLYASASQLPELSHGLVSVFPQSETLGYMPMSSSSFFRRDVPVPPQPEISQTSTILQSYLQSLDRHTEFVYFVIYSPDGTRLASGSRDKTVKIWDIATGRCLQTLEGHTDWVYSSAYSPNGNCLASGSQDRTIKIWDSASGRCLRILEGHNRGIESVAYSPGGARLASASADKTIKIWDSATGRCLKTFEGHKDSVGFVTYSPGGTRLASASYDKTIKVWDFTGRCMQTLKGHKDWVWSLSYSSDGARLASASADKTVKIWDSATGRCLQTLGGHNNHVSSVVYSPDSTRLASASHDKTIKIWDSATGRCLRTLGDHSGAVESIAYSPDGTRLASTSQDRTIKIWNVL